MLGEMRKQVWGPEIMEKVGFSQWSPHLSGPPALGLLCMAAHAVRCTTLGALVADYLVDDTPGTVQCCSPRDSPKASCLMGEMLRLEVRVFKSPRAKKWSDQI